MPPIELPHSCSNGNDDLPEAESFTCPHQWLCDGTLLCLLDAKHNENITAFQERWRRSEVRTSITIVVGVVVVVDVVVVVGGGGGVVVVGGGGGVGVVINLFIDYFSFIVACVGVRGGSLLR